VVTLSINAPARTVDWPMRRATKRRVRLFARPGPAPPSTARWWRARTPALQTTWDW